MVGAAADYELLIFSAFPLLFMLSIPKVLRVLVVATLSQGVGVKRHSVFKHLAITGDVCCSSDSSCLLCSMCIHVYAHFFLNGFYILMATLLHSP